MFVWWVRLTSERERATTLACFRVAVALVIISSLVSVAAAGLVGVVWVDAAYGGLRAIESGFWLLDLCGGPTSTAVWALFWTAIAAATAMALGIGGRWPILVALYCYRAVSSSGLSNGGYDSVIFDGAWLLFLSQSTATLSLDCRRKTGAWTSDELVPAWPRYLVIFQLVIIYAFTGFQKTSASWTPAHGYSALYWFLQDPMWVNFDSSWTVTLYPLTQVMTAIVWHFETSAPLLLLVYYYRNTRDRPGRVRALFNRFDLRKLFAVVGLGFHLGILLLMSMGPFSWITMSYYICLWRPEEIEAIALRVLARRSAPEPAVDAEACVQEGA